MVRNKCEIGSNECVVSNETCSDCWEELPSYLSVDSGPYANGLRDLAVHMILCPAHNHGYVNAMMTAKLQSGSVVYETNIYLLLLLYPISTSAIASASQLRVISYLY